MSANSEASGVSGGRTSSVNNTVTSSEANGVTSGVAPETLGFASSDVTMPQALLRLFFTRMTTLSGKQ